MKISNTESLLIEVLILARTAPTKEYKDVCVTHANELSKGLTDKQKESAAYGAEATIKHAYLVNRKTIENRKQEDLWKI